MDWFPDRQIHVKFANGSHITIPEDMWEFTDFGLVTNYSDVTMVPITKLYPWGQIQEVMQYPPTDA